MKKPKLWRGNSLEGKWIVSRKLDGVRAFISKEGCYSRNGKPLYNLDKFIRDDPQDVEVYLGSWEASITAVRSSKVVQDISPDHLYFLDPLDDRLVLDEVVDPDADQILAILDNVLAKGDEGIVLRQGDTWLKVKPTETYDVKIVGLLPGKGKHNGKLGAFITSMGNVGTGLTDHQRIEYNIASMIGETVEVECMSLTPDGKFRHPRFVRIRYDK